MVFLRSPTIQSKLEMTPWTGPLFETKNWLETVDSSQPAQLGLEIFV